MDRMQAGLLALSLWGLGLGVPPAPEPLVVLFGLQGNRNADHSTLLGSLQSIAMARCAQKGSAYVEGARTNLTLSGHRAFAGHDLPKRSWTHSTPIRRVSGTGQYRSSPGPT